MAYIQERKTDDGKTHYRVQVRLKGYPPASATFERKTDAKRGLLILVAWFFSRFVAARFD